MTTPGPRLPWRRIRPHAAVVGACALVWIVCSVAVVWLAGASGVAEDRRYVDPSYAGPSQDELEVWLVVAFYLGVGALVTGTCLLARGAARRRAARSASREPGLL